MATVVDPSTGVIRNSFVPVAKHYGVRVVACPPRRGNRKGAVEKNVHFSTGRFWRTMTARTRSDAQAAFDRFCEGVGDARPRPVAKLAELPGGEGPAAVFLAERGRCRPTVADLAALERLGALPAGPYPASVESDASVDRHCLVAFEGNRYSLPPGLMGAAVRVRHRLGTDRVEIVSAGGVILASHRRHTPGAGYVVRDPTHKHALEGHVLAAFNTDPPCRRKANRPPSERALAEAAKLLGQPAVSEPTVDLDEVAEVIRLAFPGSTVVDRSEVTA
jgi:hypothetical protein